MSFIPSLLSLPLEIHYLVYSYLSKKDAKALSRTCRNLRNSYYNESLQKELFTQHFPQFSLRNHPLASEQYARVMAQTHCLGIICLDTRNQDFNREILRLAISDDGTKALSASSDPVLKLWKIKDNRMQLQQDIQAHRMNTLLASDCEINKVLIGNIKTLTLWNLEEQPEKLKTIFNPISINYIAMNPKGTIAAIGFSNYTIKFMNLVQNQLIPLESVDNHEDDIACIEFRRDGKRAISLCKKSILMLWELNKAGITCKKKLILNAGSRSLVMVPDESRVVFSRDTKLGVYDFSAPESSYIQTLQRHHEFITCLASDLANGRVLSGSRDTTINIWQIGKNSAFLLQTIHGHQAALSCLALTPDGSILLSGDMGHTIKMWRLNSLPHECITRALERCNAQSPDPLGELPHFAKRNIYELLYEKWQATGNPKKPNKISESELMSWGDDIFRERIFMPEKIVSLQTYIDYLKFPRYFAGSPSIESIV